MSYLFDDAADRLLITSNVPPSNDAFTHMGYYRRDVTTGGLQTLVARIKDDLNPYIWFGLLADGTFYYEDSAGGGGSFGVQIVEDTWTHVAMARNNTSARLWINGVLTTTTGSSLSLGAVDRYELGGWRSTNGNRWNGNIGVCKAWNVILSDAEVAAEVGLAEPQLLTNLYGAWPLLEDTQDYSGNNNHWTPSGVTLSGAVPGVDYGAYAGGSVVPQVVLHRMQNGT